MNRMLSLCAMLAVAGCYAQPRPAVVAAAQDAYDCMVRVLGDAGYIVLDGNRSGGFVRAEKNITSATEEALFGHTFWRVMTVTIYQQDGGEMLRVTPSRQIQERGGRRTVRVGEADNTEASELAARCSTR